MQEATITRTTQKTHTYREVDNYVGVSVGVEQVSHGLSSILGASDNVSGTSLVSLMSQLQKTKINLENPTTFSMPL